MDYLALRSLDAVLRNQSFNRAARELGITQSAVSQRLAQLEGRYGQRILIRELPYRPTGLGETLLAHFRKVVSLEQAIQLELGKSTAPRPTFKIAVNLDSLELWFGRVLQDETISGQMNLEIVTDDEKYTLQHLRAGKVDLSIGSADTAVSNHDCVRLGRMTYLLVSTPEFKRRYFKGGLTRATLAAAPAVVFNEKDDLHASYLASTFGYGGSYPHTAVPSVAGFKRAILAGFGYGVIPLVDIEAELRSRRLLRLQGEGTLSRELYLHHWNYQAKPLRDLIDAIRKAAKGLR